MSEEIKEILDKLNEDKDYDDYVDYKGSYFKPLLDYINNLQDRIDKALDYLKTFVEVDVLVKGKMVQPAINILKGDDTN